ncbi:TraG family conjugative transposon ATPase [Chryseobacterium sp. A321]
MTLKKTIFQSPYLGFDLGLKNGWDYDVLIDSYGMPVIGLSIQNLSPQHSCDPDLYLEQHRVLSQIVSILGEGFTLQKLDLFSKETYVSEIEPQQPFLKQKFKEHFEGRIFSGLETLLLVSPYLEDSKKKNLFKVANANYKLLREKAERIFLLLESSRFEPKFLKQKEFETKINQVLSMNFTKVPGWDTLLSTSEHLRIGESYIKVFSLVDVEKVELPSLVKPYGEMSLGSTMGSGLKGAVDKLSFLHHVKESQSLVYHQMIRIPPQEQTLRSLEKKRKKHEGVASSAPSNALVAQEIEEFIKSLAFESELLVEAHFSIAVRCEDPEKLSKVQSQIEQHLFNQGILISKNSYNQLELFRCALPGNAAELKSYDLFLTSRSAALCFFFNERYLQSEDSDFFLEFTDRQGVPIKLDPSDLPMQNGRISNRNKFVLGPSGSGKSFLMNSLVEQYLNYNYDVVIVDTGDSYKGLSLYKKGRYIQYTEADPITMNPFLISKEELTLEKIEFLTSLVFLVWKGSESTMSSAQKSILDKLVLSYYEHYFNSGIERFESLTPMELAEYLKDFGIEVETFAFDKESAETKVESKKSLQSRLEIPYSQLNDPASEYGVKPLKLESRDKQTSLRVQNTLGALGKGIGSSRFSSSSSSSSFKLEPIRPLLLEKVTELHKELRVSELSFNSFYEFASVFLPLFLRGKRYEISEREFSLSTFFLVLKDFYRGGRYARTLNEKADRGLLTEPFLVFEIDSIKDNPKLFPIVTLIIMDTFLQKMRLRKNRRKALIIEEAWKAIASELMGSYILYLYKTVRKFYGEAIVVTQELDDVISSPIVKDSILNNSDTIILLDQTKFRDNFSKIASLLALNPVEQNKIFTLNQLDNKENRSRFKEFYIKRGASGEVYGNEVSLAQYMTFTTEKPEKTAFEVYLSFYSDFEWALENFLSDLKNSGLSLSQMVKQVNERDRPLSQSIDLKPKRALNFNSFTDSQKDLN